VDRARLGRLHVLECQRLVRFMPKVVIAVVPGWAAGGGHSLHVIADLTVASAEHASPGLDRRVPASTIRPRGATPAPRSDAEDRDAGRWRIWVSPSGSSDWG